VLSPDIRSLYTAALTPPPGLVLDQALATTFSVDPTTLLTIPLHLALLHRGRDVEEDGIALLEALRRVTERTTVYAQRGRMVDVDAAEQAAEKALEAARDALASAALRVCCERENDGWTLVVEAQGAVHLEGIADLRAWPLTVAQERAAAAMSLVTSGRAPLGRFAIASVTGLVAFELTAVAKPRKLRLALNLPIEGLPAERDATIVRTVVRNRDGFLRYLLLLLGNDDAGEPGAPAPAEGRGSTGSGGWGSGAFATLPLLEELTQRSTARRSGTIRRSARASSISPRASIAIGIQSRGLIARRGTPWWAIYAIGSPPHACTRSSRTWSSSTSSSASATCSMARMRQPRSREISSPTQECACSSSLRRRTRCSRSTTSRRTTTTLTSSARSASCSRIRRRWRPSRRISSGSAARSTRSPQETTARWLRPAPRSRGASGA
jgi:hypothetical protein